MDKIINGIINYHTFYFIQNELKDEKINLIYHSIFLI